MPKPMSDSSGRQLDQKATLPKHLEVTVECLGASFPSSTGYGHLEVLFPDRIPPEFNHGRQSQNLRPPYLAYHEDLKFGETKVQDDPDESIDSWGHYFDPEPDELQEDWGQGFASIDAILLIFKLPGDPPFNELPKEVLRNLVDSANRKVRGALLWLEIYADQSLGLEYNAEPGIRGEVFDWELSMSYPVDSTRSLAIPADGRRPLALIELGAAFRNADLAYDRRLSGSPITVPGISCMLMADSPLSKLLQRQK